MAGEHERLAGGARPTGRPERREPFCRFTPCLPPAGPPRLASWRPGAPGPPFAPPGGVVATCPQCFGHPAGERAGRRRARTGGAHGSGRRIPTPGLVGLFGSHRGTARLERAGPGGRSRDGQRGLVGLGHRRHRPGGAEPGGQRLLRQRRLLWGRRERVRTSGASLGLPSASWPPVSWPGWRWKRATNCTPAFCTPRSCCPGPHWRSGS